jgi:nicotinamidase/pyrazinamidase
MLPRLSPDDALIVVDMQNDFCSGGALPVPHCDAVLTVLNRWLDAAVQGGSLVVASRDWHPADHASFSDQGGLWPKHCVQGTHGAEFHAGLRLPPGTLRVNKGCDRETDGYSAFAATGLADDLRQRGIQRLWIGGVALDYCVRATALDAIQVGFEVHLIVPGTSPVDETAGERTLEELRGRGVILETE